MNISEIDISDDVSEMLLFFLNAFWNECGES
jgi:hypothetical protein